MSKCENCGHDISEYAPGLSLCAICDGSDDEADEDES